MASAAMTSTAWRAIAGVQPGLALVEAEAVLAEFEIFFSQPLLIPVKEKSSLAFRMYPDRY
jgi:hypothetical protein